uniref:Uncharacterized protein n=1 Tax=viral metagenome TaxID=1070528 RepID=A0A6M3M722_9ZZZZ
MPALPAEQYTRLNLMAGTARSLEQELLTSEDVKVWERDFALLCDDLTKLVDPDIGADLRSEKAFYEAALQVAKGYFDKLPFGGLKSATGQFGFRLIGPQDLKSSSTTDLSPVLWSWVRTLAMTSGNTEVANAFSAAFYASSKANASAVIAWHRLLSYKPAPRLLYVQWKVNEYPYAPYSVEPYSKIAKENKLFKIVPMPGRIILHPGGKCDCDMYFDRETGSTDPSGSANIDVEIGLFGLVFGEYDYLAATGLDAYS